MNAGATIFFIVSLLVFLVTFAYIVTTQPPNDTPDDAPSSVPDETYIGQKNCPVACTCFPKPVNEGYITFPQTFCARLENGEMFKCPQGCCTPSCF